MLSNRFAHVNLRDRELARQYRDYYPESLAFKNPDLTTSIEHMLLEFKLENLIAKCNSNADGRSENWLSELLNPTTLQEEYKQSQRQQQSHKSNYNTINRDTLVPDLKQGI